LHPCGRGRAASLAWCHESAYIGHGGAGVIRDLTVRMLRQMKAAQPPDVTVRLEFAAG